MGLWGKEPGWRGDGRVEQRGGAADKVGGASRGLDDRPEGCPALLEGLKVLTAAPSNPTRASVSSRQPQAPCHTHTGGGLEAGKTGRREEP